MTNTIDTEQMVRVTVPNKKKEEEEAFIIHRLIHTSLRYRTCTCTVKKNVFFIKCEKYSDCQGL